MTNALQKAIQAAIQAEGNSEEANKAYLEFIKANFLMPVEAFSDQSNPIPLYFQQNGEAFLPVFTERAILDEWAQDIKERIMLLTLSGVDLLKGVGEHVHICLDIGRESYKVFNPSELARMRSMVIKLFGSDR